MAVCGNIDINCKDIENVVGKTEKNKKSKNKVKQRKLPLTEEKIVNIPRGTCGNI